ncbi:MAG: phenylalanine--tRNA ligase subunit alpha, partial [Alphaproteobacteria bacterium]
MENFNQIESDILNKIKNVSDRNALDSIKTEIFGKKGVITELFNKIRSLDQSQRKEYASKLNELKTKVTEIFEKKLVDFDQSAINKKLKNEKIDITLPGRTYF